MPDNVFQITFTVNLAPYAAGLRSMVTMNQAAGVAMREAMAGRAADMQPIEQELARVTEEMRQVVVEAQMTGKAVGGIAPEAEKATVATTKQATAHEGHSESLRGVRREAMHMVGAIAFLVTSMTDVAEGATGGDKQMKKFTTTIKEGVMEGFGVGSMLMLAGASAGASLAIGAAVTTGVGLLKFFDDSEEKAKRATAALENFNRGLKGAKVEDLEAYRQAISDAIVARSKAIADLEKVKFAMYASGNIAAGIAAQKAAGMDMEGLKVLQSSFEAISKDIESKKMNDAELKQQTENQSPEAVAGKYAQMRAKAEEENRKAVEKINNADIKDAKVKQDALDQQAKIYANKQRAIQDEELKEKEQFKLKIAGVEQETAKTVLDVNEKKELALARTELDRLAITEAYAIKRIDIEEAAQKLTLKLERDRMAAIGGPDALKRIKEIDAELAALTTKYGQARSAVRVASGIKVDDIATGTVGGQEQKIKDLREQLAKQTTQAKRDELQKQIKDEEETLFRMTHTSDEYYKHLKDLEDERKRVWAATHGFLVSVAQTTATILSDIFKEMLNADRAAMERQLQMREVDYQLSRIDGEKRKKDLASQLHQGKISHEEYNLQLRKMDLERAAQEEELNKAREGFTAKAYQTIKGVVESALAELLKKEIENLIISTAMHETSEGAKTAATATGTTVRGGMVLGEIGKELMSAGASMVKAVASVTEWLAAELGPFAFLAVPLEIAAAVGAFAGMKSAFGFEEGGRFRKGQRGYIEGYGNEIIAPEKTFLQVAREELIPKALNLARPEMSRVSFASSSSSSAGVPSGSDLRALADALKNIKLNLELKGQDLHASWRLADKKYTRGKL